MTRDICVRPSLALFVAGLTLCAYALMSSDSIAATQPFREPYPELAIQNGYFVDHEEVVKRGGVGNYVFRPTGKEEKRMRLYREVGEFSTFHRDADGALEIRLDRNALFGMNEYDLKPAAKRKLDKLSELIALEGVQSPAVYTRTESSPPGLYDQSLADQRAMNVQEYLDERLVSAELVGYADEEAAARSDDERRTRKTEVILDE